MSGLLARLGVVALLVAGCSAIPQVAPDGGVVVDGWVFPTPFPVPDGARRLPLDVQPPPASIPAGVSVGACPMARLGRLTLVVERQGDDRRLEFRGEGGGAVGIRWPTGVSAMEAGGVATVVAPDGTVLVMEGEESAIEFGGGWIGDRFAVCGVGEQPHRLDGSPP